MSIFIFFCQTVESNTFLFNLDFLSLVLCAVKWLLYACPRLSLPLPVTMKRLAADCFVFNARLHPMCRCEESSHGFIKDNDKDEDLNAEEKGNIADADARGKDTADDRLTIAGDLMNMDMGAILINGVRTAAKRRRDDDSIFVPSGHEQPAYKTLWYQSCF